MDKQRGLSLIELMVAMVIGLVITGAVLQVFISNKNTFVTQNASGHLQENGRFALQYLAGVIRPAGVGMGFRLEEEQICVVAANNDSTAWAAMGRPVWGQRVTAAGSLGLVGSDELTLSSTDDCDSFLADGEYVRPGGNANAKVTAYCPSMQQDAAVMVTDMEKAVILRITNKPNGNGNGNVTLTHAAGNNDKDAKCGGFKFSEIVFANPARVLGFGNKTFFVAETDRPAATGGFVRALFVRDNTAKPAAITEIVEGVENMRISYGVTSEISVGVESYLSATEVETAKRWGDVHTLKIDLLLVNDERVPGAKGQTISFDGAAVAADGRLRKVFSTVVALRNRIEN